MASGKQAANNKSTTRRQYLCCVSKRAVIKYIATKITSFKTLGPYAPDVSRLLNVVVVLNLYIICCNVKWVWAQMWRVFI